MVSLASNAQSSFFFVGSATDKISDPITLCSMDLTNGKLSKVNSFEGTKSSSYLCISSDQKYLYAVNGESLNPKSKDISVASFEINPNSKELTLINKQSVEGQGACHVSLTSDNKFLLVANYGSGNIVVLPIDKDGSLKPVSSNMQHVGSGPDEDRQKSPHAHYIQSSKDNKYVFAVDLGIDKVMNYTLNSTTGVLTENSNQPFLKLEGGVGPRHMIIHENEKYAYILNEMSSSISACAYDAKKGIFSIIETHPMLPEDFKEFSKAAAIRMHPSGRYVYGSNRGHDSIVVFEIGYGGNISRKQIMQDGIEWPRDYNIQAEGKFMIVANRNKDELRTLEIDATGQLSMTNYTLKVVQPTSIQFLD
jgi:6-phosphogluconolactonase